MSVDDRTRLNLHRKLDTVLGSEEADTLMAHLPPVTWNEVVTKDDLGATGATLRVEMQAMGSELRSEMHAMASELRSEMQAMGSELRSEMQVMKTELRSEMHSMGSELRTEMQVGFADLRTEMASMRADFIDGTNRQIKWLVTFAAAWSSLLVTVVRFMP